MSKQFLLLFVVGLVAVAGVVGFVLMGTKGAVIGLEGKILKVRVHPMSENTSVVIVDFRVTNPADIPFVMKSATILLTPANGEVPESTPFPKSDLMTLFQYDKLLGPAFNEPLISRDKVLPKATIDRMTAARFEMPEAAITNRKALTLRIDEVDGQFSEITESGSKK